jgi:hypothetical protein
MSTEAVATGTAAVNDVQGNSLGNVKVGETVLVSLRRLRRDGLGGMYDKHDLGLLDDEVITAEGGPYLFKETPQQQNGKLRCCSRILVFNLLLEYGNDSLFSYLYVDKWVRMAPAHELDLTRLARICSFRSFSKETKSRPGANGQSRRRFECGRIGDIHQKPPDRSVCCCLSSQIARSC